MEQDVEQKVRKSANNTDKPAITSEKLEDNDALGARVVAKNILSTIDEGRSKLTSLMP
jgi:hypothetical protein